MKKMLVLGIVCLIGLGCSRKTDPREAEMNRFVDQLMAQMTLAGEYWKRNTGWACLPTRTVTAIRRVVRR